MRYLFYLFLMFGVPFLWIVGVDDVERYFQVSSKGQSTALFLFALFSSVVSFTTGLVSCYVDAVYDDE